MAAPVTRELPSGEATVRELERSPLYSEELGIDLASGDDNQYFLWFVASLLFGGRISETIAKNTYKSFVRHRLTTPRQILKAGWDFLVYAGRRLRPLRRPQVRPGA